MSLNLSGATTALFVVKLSKAVAEPVTISWITEDGTARAGLDYVAAAGSFVFEPGETEKGIEVVVLGREDGSTGDGLTFYVRVKPPINAVLLDELNECRITVETDDGVTTTSLVVATGPRGTKGNPGLSTYELAKQQGYQGSLSDWLGAAGVQAVADAAQAAAMAKEQLNRSLRFAPGKTVPELPPIENMEGQILVVRGGKIIGMTADGATAQGLTVNLAKNTGSQMVGHLDKLDGTNKTVGQALDNLADAAGEALKQAGTFEAGVASLKRVNQYVWDAETKTYYYWTGSFPKAVPAGSSPDSTGGTGTGKWMAAGAAVLETALAHATGLSQIGGFDSFDDLRSTQPAYDGQIVQLKGWRAGSFTGGGQFVGHLSPAYHDGGYIAASVNGSQWHWKRLKNVEDLTILDFGAYVDGKTDDMFAVKAMYLATRALSATNPLGVVLPAGSVALSGTYDLSRATEQPMFRIRGPHITYGQRPITKIIPLDGDSTVPLFQVNARRMEVHGIHIETPTKTNKKPFLKNFCGRGEYVRVSCVCVTNSAGLTFDLLDTIDTKFDQIYGYSMGGGFLFAGWTNGQPGTWDHSTAIEFTNFNFTSCTGVETIRAVRATQAIMRNGWWTDNEYSFDISQGGWILDTVICEGSRNPAKMKNAKVIRINTRFEQGATLDWEASTYDPAMDQGNPVPSWVTNLMDQGQIHLDLTGTRFQCGVSSYFDFSETLLYNSTGAEKWIEVGRMTLQDKGRVAHMRVLGASGWDNASGALNVPGATNFGGGEAHIYIEAKAPAADQLESTEVHWYGTGTSPITDVKYVRSYSTYTIYVKMAAYAMSAAVFLEASGSARVMTNKPFYFIPSKVDVADINAVSNIKSASARFAFSKGSYNDNGFGFDLDAGLMTIFSTEMQTVGSEKYIPIMLNGTKLYLTTSPGPGKKRMQLYPANALPDAGEWARCMIYVTGSDAEIESVPAYSTGSSWRYFHNPTKVVAPKATS